MTLLPIELGLKFTDLEILQIPILMSIQSLVDDTPAHRMLDHVIIIWDIIWRNRVLEIIISVDTVGHIRN